MFYKSDWIFLISVDYYQHGQINKYISPQTMHRRWITRLQKMSYINISANTKRRPTAG